MQIEPSPTAEATRFTLVERASPTQNTAGILVSMRYGRRDKGQRALARSSGSRSEPVFTKRFSSRTRQPSNRTRVRIRARHQKKVADAAGFGFTGVDVPPPDFLETVVPLELLDLS